MSLSTLAASSFDSRMAHRTKTRKRLQDRDECQADESTTFEHKDSEIGVYSQAEWTAASNGQVCSATFRIGSGNLQPRVHQQQVVSHLIEEVRPLLDRTNIVSRNFLIQHSTGSGKSLTLAWLVTELLTLKVDDGGCFDLVLVLNDRRILDNQISPIVENFLGRVNTARRLSSKQEAEQSLTRKAATERSIYEEERELGDDDSDAENPICDSSKASENATGPATFSILESQNLSNYTSQKRKRRKLKSDANIEEFNFLVHQPDTGRELESILQCHATKVAQVKSVVICTLQKFPSVSCHLRNYFASRFSKHGRRIAIIADEAHRSHGKTATAHINDLLGGDTSRGLDVRETQPLGLCLFGFTATPAPSALRLFGTRQEDTSHAASSSASRNGALSSLVYRPFHVYSMRQAVDDGVILNVLDNFTFMSPDVKIKGLPKHVRSRVALSGHNLDLKARSTLLDAAMNHEAVISSKAKKIVQHFFREIKSMAPFRPKAMVVCRSRASVVQFCLAIRKEVSRLRRKKRSRLERRMDSQDEAKASTYPNVGSCNFNSLMLQCEPVKVYAAFSGDVVTRSMSRGVNSNLESSIVDEKLMNKVVHFNDARIFVVCNKLETGFDDPQLACMYVDRVLRGAHCVQVMSRLNRVAPQKLYVSVVDFVNPPTAVHTAFSQFWDGTSVKSTECPHLFHSPRADALVSQILSSMAATMRAGAEGNPNPGEMTVNDVARKIVAAGVSSQVLPLLDQYTDLCSLLSSQKMSLPLHYAQRLANVLRGRRGFVRQSSTGATSSHSAQLVTDQVLSDMRVTVNDFATEFCGSIKMANAQSRSPLPWIPLSPKKLYKDHKNNTDITLASAVENIVSNSVDRSVAATANPSQQTVAGKNSMSQHHAYPTHVVMSLKNDIVKMLEADDFLGLASLLHRLTVVPVTISSLRATGIGKLMNKISQNSAETLKKDNDILTTCRDLAKHIVGKWKRMVATSNRQRKSHKCSQNDQERRKKACSHILASLLTAAKKSGKSCSAKDSEELAKLIECAMYQRWCRSLQSSRNVGGKVSDASKETKIGTLDFQEYGRVLRMLSANLKRNESLYESLVDGSLKPHTLVTMRAQDLATTQQQEERRRTQLENSDLAKFEGWKEKILAERKEGGLQMPIKCPACGGVGAFINELPSTTSMAGVGNQKPGFLATCVHCESVRPFD